MRVANSRGMAVSGMATIVTGARVVVTLGRSIDVDRRTDVRLALQVAGTLGKMSNMESHVSASFVTRNFSSILDRVATGGETFVVERRGQPVCRIEPVGTPKRTVTEFSRLLPTVPAPDPEFWDDVEKAIRDQTPPPDIKW